MKTTLTHQEMLIAVRAHYNLPEDTEIVIEGQRASTGDWISNIGRDEYGPPDTLPDAQIEVKFRDGDTRIGFVYIWDECWKETDNDPNDIIAYRVIK